MRTIFVLFAASAVCLLSGCSVVGAAADVTGTVVSTTVGVTSSVIGAGARTVSGGRHSDSDSESK